MIFKLRLIYFITLFYLIFQSNVLSDVVKKIEVKGNERISKKLL